MYTESHEFTFLHFVEIYGLLKSGICYLLYSVCSCHMCIHKHHDSSISKLALLLSSHSPILLNIMFVEIDALANGGTYCEVDANVGVVISPTMPCDASIAITTSTCCPTNPTSSSSTISPQIQISFKLKVISSTSFSTMDLNKCHAMICTPTSSI